MKGALKSKQRCTLSAIVQLPVSLRQGSYRKLWPLAALIGGEVLALFWLARAGPLPITRLSLGVAVAALLTGLIPALLRPGTESLLAGCIAVAGAGLLVIPLDAPSFGQPWPPLPAVAWPAAWLFRLANAAALGPLAFHLAARFPCRNRLSDRVLASVYGATGLFWLAPLLARPGDRLAILAISFIWFSALLLAALVQLLLAGRAVGAADLRSVQQARLLAAVLVISYTPVVVRMSALLWGRTPPPQEIVLVGQLIWPIGVAYIVLRHDLFEIDAVLRRALAYVILSLALLALYLGLTVLLTTGLMSAWPQFRGAAILLALLIAAAGFAPLQRRAEHAIDRLLYPERLAFRREVAAAQDALSTVIGRAEIIHLLAEQLPARLGLSWGALALAAHAEELPERQPAWSAALTVGDRTLGWHWLGPRPAGPPFDAGEQAQLRTLAQHAALALAYVETIDALNALNRELEARVARRTAQLIAQQRTLAVYEERQRLARDLHDSVTQTLFSISLGVRNARALMPRNGAAAVAALAEQEAAARNALAEMRSLLAHLRSPAPEEDEQMDVAQALREHCAALERQVGLVVLLEAPPSLMQPLGLAQEALKIAREALHNVLKHAGVSQATCRLACDDDWLHLTVQDAGRGFDSSAPAVGLGLAGMRERAAAWGGALTVTSAVGQGTVIQVRLPLSGRVGAMAGPAQGAVAFD